jgi:hypothetical protein
MGRVVAGLLLVLIFFSPIITELNITPAPGLLEVSKAFIGAVIVAAALFVALYLFLFGKMLFGSEDERHTSPAALYLFMWACSGYAAWCTAPLFIQREVRLPVYVVIDEPVMSRYRTGKGGNGPMVESRCQHALTIRGLNPKGLEQVCADRLMRGIVVSPGIAVAVLRRSWAGRVIVAIEPG